MGDMSPVIWAEFQTVRGSATPWLYGPELALSLVSVLAIISNGSVIYVTVRSKYVFIRVLMEFLVSMNFLNKYRIKFL
jgi:hypothetical protein